MHSMTYPLKKKKSNRSGDLATLLVCLCQSISLEKLMIADASNEACLKLK